MNKDFSKIITQLRKTKGYSQKQVANDLSISQGLLSHYEKGIRECGLDFLVKIADYYDVSTDYLLGRTSKPDGSKIDPQDIPNTEEITDINQGKVDNFCLINRKILNNSNGIIYNILSQMSNRKLNRYVSQYLMTGQYNIFCKLVELNNQENTFGSLTESYCQTSMEMDMIRINTIVKSGKSYNFDLSSNSLSDKYKESYHSINNMIKNTEKVIGQTFKL